jgi:hypothetical protein
METTHELLHLYKLSFVHWKIMDIPTSFIWIIFFDGAFEYGGGSKFLGCVSTSAELLCVEFRNFVRHMLVSYLSRYC